jgi:hypothetical protein
MLPVAPAMESTNSTEAKSSSPRSMKNMPEVATTPISMKANRKRFLAALKSATAPRIGARSAITMAATVLA